MNYNIQFILQFVIKSNCFLQLFLFSYGLFAQQDNPKDIPLKGKLHSYEIFKAYGDSQNIKEFSVEKALYDRNGRILEIAKGNTNIGEQSYVKKHLYTPGKEVIYECYCKDIEPFVKEFVIRDRNELKNKPRYGTPQGPTHWVTINTLDKKENVIHSAHYSRNGYRTRDIWFEFTATNKIKTKIVFGMDSIETSSEKSFFDSKGNLTEKIIEHKGSREILVYGAQNNLIEKRFFQNNKLKIHIKYILKVKGNTKEFIINDLLLDTSYVEKFITYDSQNREIERQEFAFWGKKPRITKWEYFDNGNIKSITYYNEEGNMLRKAEYEYDTRNNWTVAKISQLRIVQEKETKRHEMQTTKYIQKIKYN